MNESDNYAVQQSILVKHSTNTKHCMEFDKPEALANIHIYNPPATRTAPSDSTMKTGINWVTMISYPFLQAFFLSLMPISIVQNHSPHPPQLY